MSETGGVDFFPADGPLPELRVDVGPIVLRPFEQRDLSLIQEASADDLIPHITTVPSTYSEQEGVAFLARQASRLVTRAGWSLVIESKQTGAAVGSVGLWISNLHRGRCEMGYWIAKSGRRAGHAAAALTALSDWAFDHLPVHRLTLYIEPWNVGSIKTAERSGFVNEATLAAWELIDGEAKDMLCFARTR